MLNVKYCLTHNRCFTNKSFLLVLTSSSLKGEPEGKIGLHDCSWFKAKG